MAVIVVRIEGDGLERMLAGGRALQKKGPGEMQRGLIDGGRKVTTQVKRALVDQTSIKKRVIDGAVRGFAEPSRWIIRGVGQGVDITDVRSVSGGKYTKRDRRALRRHFAKYQPRDYHGRFAPWGDGDERAFAEFLRRDLRSKAVTAYVWRGRKTFWQSFRDGGGAYKAIRANGRRQTLYGPAPAKELVKDDSAAAFHAGADGVRRQVEARLRRLMP